MIAIRRARNYFAMVTLAPPQLVYFRVSRGALHRGETDYRRTARSLFGVLALKSDVAMYYVVLAVFAAYSR